MPRYYPDSTDLAAPQYRDELELRLTLTNVSSSVLQMIARDLSTRDGRPLPGERITLALIEQRIRDRRERRNDYERRVAERDMAKRIVVAQPRPLAVEKA
jgi:hypothetical protein